MRNTLTIRLPKTLAEWLEEKSLRTGIAQGKIIRDQLERARKGDTASRKFMRLAGCIKGAPRNLSTRKGFARS